MADISDRLERRYIYNGATQFLIFEERWTRTGYRGIRRYTKLGNLAANPVTFEKTIWRGRPMASTSTGKPVSPIVSKPPGYFSGREKVLINDLINQATIKFYQEAANTNALLPLILKERQQTIDMVTEKVMKLVALKRNFLKELRKSWKRNDHNIVPQRWLEYRYGWLPTILDINTLINKPLGLPSALCEGKAFARYDSTGYKEGDWEFNQNGFISARVQALLIPRDPFMKSASQYGIANPSLVVWEAVPYSFVADWVFNVGGYLEHLGALNGLECINPTYSWRHTFHQEAYAKARTGLTSGYSSYKGTYGERKLGTPSYPNPFIPNNGMDLFRFFDAAALLKGQFDRFRR